MTPFRFRFLALLVAALTLSAGPASAADEPDNSAGSGTFTTPGYPSRSGQFPSGNPALQGNTPQIQGQSPRGPTGINGNGIDTRQGRSGQANEFDTRRFQL